MPKYILDENLNAEEITQRLHYLVVADEYIRVESTGNTGPGDLVHDGLDFRELHTLGGPVFMVEGDLPTGRRWMGATAA